MTKQDHIEIWTDGACEPTDNQSRHRKRMASPAYRGYRKRKAKTEADRIRNWKKTATPEQLAAYRAKVAERKRRWLATPSGREKNRARKRAAYKRAMTFINSFKKRCHKCSEAELCCLQFHHRDPATKQTKVNVLATRSRVRVLEEIAKCVVLCANCHCKVHAGAISLES